MNNRSYELEQVEESVGILLSMFTNIEGDQALFEAKGAGVILQGLSANPGGNEASLEFVVEQGGPMLQWL